MSFPLMQQAIPDILARIVAAKREEVSRVSEDVSRLERAAQERLSARRGFRASLERNSPAIIAEVKRASPSKGVLKEDFDPVRIAAAYHRGGAAALSVLTDGPFFQGSLADLEAARAEVPLPVLRKDFVLEECQVVESAAHGADAILLIAALLNAQELRRLREAAARWRLAALVEVHDERELDIALDSGADLIGVNNRNLRTFEVTLETSLRLAERMPGGVLKVSESGIGSAEDIRRLQQAGFRAFLVGEHLMRAPDMAQALGMLLA